MKKTIALVFMMVCAAPVAALAAGPAKPLDRANIDMTDTASLQRGAEYFFQYCIGCHSIQFKRYNRMGNDLGLSDDQLRERFIHTRDQSGDQTGVGELIKIAMKPDDAEEWFGQPAPDLSLTARLRGTDWIYTTLRSFYLDDSRPMGVNNAIFEAMSMPHVLWELQGWQANVGEEGHIKLEKVAEGKLTTEEYNEVVRDITNFLAYVADPVKVERHELGKWVLLFLAFFTFVAYLLKKEYWRDVH
ncbi:cytochrome c1 [Ectothiorhodospira shaposhnikovii]|uniref:cytochrome c1 n=1 Tax=Ectothiorhodospira shaposhnikovii TaxID=1054 RepID=UPI001EE7F426|nr:cytochrome c1 [Ectothiorhodospira shaposhnikovii]MCG5513425.1 cytochrome c1 [Ectothiorhodospira shaposhnikovii]